MRTGGQEISHSLNLKIYCQFNGVRNYPPSIHEVHFDWGTHEKIVRSKVTYLLTPRSRVLLEKLTGPQLVKKFPTFYGTRRFITAFTGARHLSLS